MEIGLSVMVSALRIGRNPELACGLKDFRTVAALMFNKVDTGGRPPQKLGELRLALLQWQRAQVLSVKF